jgi:hypothetical protein
VNLWSGWHLGWTSAVTATFPALNKMVCFPFEVLKDMTVDQLAVYVTTAAAASSVRLGIYTSLSSKPAALVADAGTVATTTTGTKTSTAFTAQLLRPGMYWFAVAEQGATGVALRAAETPLAIPSGAASDVLGTQRTCWIDTTSVTGALPANFTAGALPDAGAVAYVAMRRSA